MLDKWSVMDDIISATIMVQVICLSNPTRREGCLMKTALAAPLSSPINPASHKNEAANRHFLRRNNFLDAPHD
jgi:hypothetical protein